MNDGHYFNIKLNNGDKHIIFANQDEVEGMCNANIIAEYTLALDNWNTNRVYEHYVSDRLEAEIHDICYYIQKAKGIKRGDCPPDLHLQLDSIIAEAYEVIMKIVHYEEEMEEK